MSSQEISGQLVLTGQDLTILDVVEVSRHKSKQVIISEDAKKAVLESREVVNKAVAEKKVIYGITTGFGNFKNVTISEEQLGQLQENLIMSHAIGTGEPLSEEVVRAAMLIRVNSLIKGFSGVRLELVEKLLEILNNNVYPYVPSQGSVGSSGDLAPLSHIMLVILGMGEVFENGQRKPSMEILDKLGIAPIRLTAKEGLALTNGTAVMTGIASLAWYDARRLSKLADISAAMSLEVTMGTLAACFPGIHQARPHQGQILAAENMRRLSAESEVIDSHKDCDRVQDSYSLRCSPQVHGAVKDALAYIKVVVTTELNSATDNPLVFADSGEVVSGGNFHGEPIAFVMDYLGIVMSELANISERRTCRLVDPTTSEGLPAFLIPKEQAGLSSGYMIAQYTAAALVSENKVLAHPASVDSIPTSANQEDHVSMGTIAARKAREIIKNVSAVVAIELLCSAQGFDFRKPLQPGRGTSEAFRLIRQEIAFADKDRVLYPDLEKLLNTLVYNGRLLEQVEARVGKLR